MRVRVSAQTRPKIRGRENGRKLDGVRLHFRRFSTEKFFALRKIAENRDFRSRIAGFRAKMLNFNISARQCAEVRRWVGRGQLLTKKLIQLFWPKVDQGTNFWSKVSQKLVFQLFWPFSRAHIGRAKKENFEKSFSDSEEPGIRRFPRFWRIWSDLEDLAKFSRIWLESDQILRTWRILIRSSGFDQILQNLIRFWESGQIPQILGNLARSSGSDQILEESGQILQNLIRFWEPGQILEESGQVTQKSSEFPRKSRFSNCGKSRFSAAAQSRVRKFRAYAIFRA